MVFYVTTKMSHKNALLAGHKHNKTKYDNKGIHLGNHKIKQLSNEFSRDKALSYSLNR